MTDEVADAVVESKADAATQSAAEEMGWIPATRYKGDPERFVDAEEYIKRGETVLPIVKEQNKRLKAELDAVKGQSAATATALREAQGAIQQMQEQHTIQTQRAVDEAKAQLKAQLRAASEAGDHEGVAALTEQMIELNTAQAEVPKKPAPPKEAEISPEQVAWQAENPWFGTDKKRTALAFGIAQELREAGDKSVGRVFFDKIAAEVEKTLAPAKPPVNPDKTEGARASGSSGRSGGGKSYADLPSEAKAACDADARDRVGEGKRYATKAAWQAQYAKIYFGE